MNFSILRRRTWAALAGLGAVTAWSAWRWRVSATPPVLDARASLRAWVDTLLPADGPMPGALVVGVAERIEAAATPGSEAEVRLAAGLAWVQAQAVAHGAIGLAQLDEAAREAIVARAAASAPGSAARVFFQSTLDDTLYHHYADPRSWVGLGYDGPPQPRGFADHQRPPQA